MSERGLGWSKISSRIRLQGVKLKILRNESDVSFSRNLSFYNN